MKVNEVLKTYTLLSRQSIENLSGPFFVSWDVTNRCNFKCMHCLNRSGDDFYFENFQNELNVDEAQNLCEQIIEINPYSVCICGGEPLLRPDIFDILSKLTSNIQAVNMVSNGYLINEEIAEKIAKSGISMLQISLDSNNKDFHNNFRKKEGAYEHAFKAIKLMSKFNLKQFSVAFCPTKFNISDFGNYVDQIVDLGCHSIRLMPFLPLGRGYDNCGLLQPQNKEYLNLIYTIKKKEKEYSKEKLKIEWGDPLEHLYLPVYEKRKETLSMEIRSNGDICPSIYLPISIGNIRKHSLLEYWESGFKYIWENPKVNVMAEQILFVDNFKETKVKAWTNKSLDIDIYDERMELK